MTIKSEDFMLCESVTEDEAKLLNDKENIANIKFDGCRIIAVVMNNQAVLVNRKGGICNFQFEEVVEDVSKMPDGIYDGEVISHCDTFNKLQRRSGTRDRRKQVELRKEIPVKYMVFDILNINKTYITYKPLKERIEILTKVFEEFNKKFTDRKHCIEMAEYKPIKEMLDIAHREDREGVVVKNLMSFYQHKRSRDWLKCKFWNEKDLKMTKCSLNPKGIRLENDEGISVQVSGEQAKEVQKLLQEKGEVTISVQYLEETETKMLRFPSFKKIVY